MQEAQPQERMLQQVVTEEGGRTVAPARELTAAALTNATAENTQLHAASAVCGSIKTLAWYVRYTPVRLLRDFRKRAARQKKRIEGRSKFQRGLWLVEAFEKKIKRTIIISAWIVAGGGFREVAAMVNPLATRQAELQLLRLWKEDLLQLQPWGEDGDSPAAFGCIGVCVFMLGEAAAADVGASFAERPPSLLPAFRRTSREDALADFSGEEGEAAGTEFECIDVPGSRSGGASRLCAFWLDRAAKRRFFELQMCL
ncbi:hypothetical protein cyc_03977 [Cyclospora cayetanensis]|uniref:Uncharacterized protein n=1 Tax=Cyclospora cayetanensis TaxID=88456 RepID=A0A1D3D4H5_9EIME|nr:hypothetical protein cyc_03977 [Cyclospora cayetanensis]